MTSTTHNARITEPVPFIAEGGRKQAIPVGPVLVEARDGGLFDIIWGNNGQNSIALPLEAIEAAQTKGSLVLID